MPRGRSHGRLGKAVRWHVALGAGFSLVAVACVSGGSADGGTSAAAGGDHRTTSQHTTGVGGAGGGTAGSGGGGAPAEPDGSWARPFPVAALPFSVAGSTLDAVSNDVTRYAPCAPSTGEGGPEVVYRIDVPEAGWLAVTVDDVPGDAVDIDLHLLAEADADTCITRDDALLGSPVQTGTYFLVLDTWQDQSYAGAYQLDIDLITEAGSDCFVSPIECDGMLPPFVNLEVTEAPGDPGCLPGMVRVDDAYCIDRYEAMVVADTGTDWQPVSPFTHPDEASSLVALSIEGATPQGHVDQLQAEDACLGAGKRLCTNAEWQRACAGATPTTYPFGDTFEAGRCNGDRDCHPAIQLFESSDSFVWSSLDHPCISQLPEGLAPAGAYPTCTTAEGAHDMMGNLHEWTSDPAGTFRGGFYVDTAINGPGCSYATTAHNVFHYDYSTGFRCCADAL
ncbi:MAG: SUMF1/EgtB/PvdO family nonheme iron enzyme [Myxococcota bacterium]